MNTRHGIEDLIALSRRNELSTQSRRELESLVQSSHEVRLLLDAGLEFDAARSIDPGDESRVERLAQFAVRSQNVRPRNPRRSPALAMRLAAALFICAAAATGAWSAVGIGIGDKARSDDAQAADTAESKGNGQKQRSRRAASISDRGAPRQGGTPTPVATSTETVARPSLAASATTRHEPSSLPRRPLEESARALFTSANLARRERQSERAYSLYERLQSLYPNSTEAQQSRLIVGMMQLSKTPAVALQQFRQHSERSPSEVSPEALWGEALALRNLGRTTEERVVLKRLQGDFPDSAYLKSVERRLAELAKGSE